MHTIAIARKSAIHSRPAEVGVRDQQQVQLGAPPVGQQMLHPRPRLRPSAGPGRGHPPQQQDHPWPDHPRRQQVLAGQPEQQLRRVVLHRPGKQELVEILPLAGVHRPPAGVAGHLPQMARTGLLPLAVPAQFTHRDPEPLRQPAHRGVRRQGNLIGLRTGRSEAQNQDDAEDVFGDADAADRAVPHEGARRRR